MTAQRIVDVKARKVAAQVFRNFINGKITNFEFEDSMPDTDDWAVRAIEHTAWLLYDDFETHKLDGRHALSVNEKKTVVRWILFLHTDLEYKWPDMSEPGSDPKYRVEPNRFLRFFKLGAISPEEERAFKAAGHYQVWPFISFADYAAALGSPRLLAGRRRVG